MTDIDYIVNTRTHRIHNLDREIIEYVEERAPDDIKGAGVKYDTRWSIEMLDLDDSHAVIKYLINQVEHLTYLRESDFSRLESMKNKNSNLVGANKALNKENNSLQKENAKRAEECSKFIDNLIDLEQTLHDLFGIEYPDLNRIDTNKFTQTVFI